MGPTGVKGEKVSLATFSRLQAGQHPKCLHTYLALIQALQGSPLPEVNILLLSTAFKTPDDLAPAFISYLASCHVSRGAVLSQAPFPSPQSQAWPGFPQPCILTWQGEPCEPCPTLSKPEDGDGYTVAFPGPPGEKGEPGPPGLGLPGKQVSSWVIAGGAQRKGQTLPGSFGSLDGGE